MLIRRGSQKSVIIKKNSVEFKNDYQDLKIMHELLRNYRGLLILDKEQLRLQKNLRTNDYNLFEADRLKIRYKKDRAVTRKVIKFISYANGFDLSDSENILHLHSILQSNIHLTDYYFALTSGLELIFHAQNFWSPRYVFDEYMFNFGADKEGQIYWFDSIIKTVRY